ncbi:TPA: hypothetical protein HA265_07950 [Candidatus Woesearchaeota archaeon]|nr:hypothetical protein [Candidatus Woesearchaeota archaeon]
MASTFRGVIEFFVRLGIYDVVLPFLLVFTIMFAILEKTKVLGVEKTKDGDYTRKNLNSMVAFVTAFLVVASSRLVAIINETLANMVLLLMLSVCFLILIGSFMRETKEGISLEKTWMYHVFVAIMFIGIALIFLNALGWLYPAWRYITAHYDSTAFASILLMAFVVGIMYVLVKEPKSKKSEGSS